MRTRPAPPPSPGARTGSETREPEGAAAHPPLPRATAGPGSPPPPAVVPCLGIRLLRNRFVAPRCTGAREPGTTIGSSRLGPPWRRRRSGRGLRMGDARPLLDEELHDLVRDAVADVSSAARSLDLGSTHPLGASAGVSERRAGPQATILPLPAGQPAAAAEPAGGDRHPDPRPPPSAGERRGNPGPPLIAAPASLPGSAGGRLGGPGGPAPGANPAGGGGLPPCLHPRRPASVADAAHRGAGGLPRPSVGGPADPRLAHRRRVSDPSSGTGGARPSPHLRARGRWLRPPRCTSSPHLP